ncbi:MAG: BLUF domain-containing protein [Aequorivita sp.]
MLYSLCYISNAVKLWQQDQLHQLYNSCKLRNRINGITGILIYCEGTFIEVLEGKMDRLHHLFSQIRNDERHDQITLMLDSPIEHRLFNTFRTASLNLSSLKLLNSFELELQRQKPSKYTKKLQAIIKPFFEPAHVF